MVGMIDIERKFSALLVCLCALGLAESACGGDPGAMEPTGQEAPEVVDASEFVPIPLRACERAFDDGLPSDKRSLFAMIATLGARGYQIHQVSANELTIYTAYRDIHGITVGWRIRFGGDGAGEIGLPETMPPQSPRNMAYTRKWARGLGEVFDELKCRGIDDLRRRCEKAGFSF